MSGRLRLLLMPNCHPTSAKSRRRFATQLIHPTLGSKYERTVDHLAGFAPLLQNAIDVELCLRSTRRTTTLPIPPRDGDRVNIVIKEVTFE
jgi:hypothetical protein